MDLSFIKKNNLNLYVSYCLVNKYSINFFGVQEGAVYLLGYDYLSILDFVKKYDSLYREYKKRKIDYNSL